VKVPPGHWSGYTNRNKSQVWGRVIADAINCCCDTGNTVTIKLLWEGRTNVNGIASMTNQDSVKNSVMNICKPGGGSQHNMVLTMSEQKLQVFAF
jgi:CobQ-like glutamine amidotransferase family enzyme